MPGGDKTPAGLERLKELVGTWNGTDPEGKPVTITYKLVSADNSVLEMIDFGEKKGSMVTVYHLDKNKTMMTHYCSMGNQPRMILDKSGKDPNRLSFRFVDATNLESKDAPHMHGMTFTFKDKDHFIQEWTMRANGKDSPVSMNLERAN